MKKILTVIGLLTSLTAAPTYAADEPVSTTATYGSWTVRCNMIAASADAEPQKLCEMVQSIRIRDTGQVLMEIALGRLNEADPISMVFKLPSVVWLRTDVTVSFGEAVKPSPDFTASYFRCQPDFCLADVGLDADQQTAILAENSLVVGFADGTQKPINVPISLDGFGAAFNSIFAAAE